MTSLGRPHAQARIARLSEMIAELEESRSRASETHRAQLDLDIQRLAERRAGLREQLGSEISIDGAGGRVKGRESRG
jgi:hypothetical protein